MSARSRTAAGPTERGWPRAVPEVLCERPHPQQPLAQSHSHPFFRSLPWSLFCVVQDICSVSRRIASMLQFSRIVRDRVAIRFHVVLVFHRIFGSTALRGDLGVRIIAAARRPCHLSQDTQIRWRVISVCLHLARHTEFTGFSLCLSYLATHEIPGLVSCP